MNRRDFLLSSTALALSPSLSAGQEKPLASAAKGDIVFADFESGTYDGWTLEGNCWTPEPYSDRYFPGKITGFQGKRFLCTLHPTKGSATTGKAISKEFIIEKPFITFRIGGGNHSEKACITLVVDGKAMRVQTGNGSAALERQSWEVYEFIGKRARLEVIDTTTSPERGYIMVDDIRFGSLLPASKDFTEIDEIIAHHIERHSILGGAVAVTWRGNPVFLKGYGFSNHERTRNFTSTLRRKSAKVMLLLGFCVTIEVSSPRRTPHCVVADPLLCVWKTPFSMS